MIVTDQIDVWKTTGVFELITATKRASTDSEDPRNVTNMITLIKYIELMKFPLKGLREE